MTSNQRHFNTMKRFSLRLTEAEYIKLKNYCEELNISMNDVIRHLVREWSPPRYELNNNAQKEESR
jgi:transcriptional antiterminator